MPGVGPLIASAMVAAIGNGAAFIKGRDFAAWLGLVPKQISTGDRTILSGISRRGNRSFVPCSFKAPVPLRMTVQQSSSSIGSLAAALGQDRFFRSPR